MPRPSRPPEPPPAGSGDATFARFGARLAVVGAVTLIVVIMWSAPLVPFLVLAAVLVALLLDGLGDLVRRGIGRVLRVAIPRAVGLLAAMVLLAGAATATIAYLGPELSGQADLIQERLPDAVAELEADLSRFALGRAILKEAPSAEEVADTLQSGPDQNATDGPSRDAPPASERSPRPQRGLPGAPTAPAAEDVSPESDGDGGINVGSIFTSTFGALVDLVIVVVLGLYLAVSPLPYIRGVLRLIPPAHRRDAVRLLRELENLLKRWLAGRFIAMLTITLMIWAGLTLVGVSFALSLAVLAGALSFIPNIGPIAATIPGVLLALLEGGLELALAAGAVYLVAQLLESYLVTPQVEKRAVRIPPALLLLTQVLIGVLFGFIGLLLATPLTVIVLVLVRRIYVEGVLGNDDTDTTLGLGAFEGAAADHASPRPP